MNEAPECARLYALTDTFPDMNSTTPFPNYSSFPTPAGRKRRRVPGAADRYFIEQIYNGVGYGESELIPIEPIEFDGTIRSVTFQLYPSTEDLGAIVSQGPKSVPTMKFKVRVYDKNGRGRWKLTGQERLDVVTKTGQQTVELVSSLPIRSGQFVGLRVLQAEHPAVLMGVEGNDFTFDRPEVDAAGNTGRSKGTRGFDNCGWHVNVEKNPGEKAPGGWADWKRKDTSRYTAFGYVSFQKQIAWLAMELADEENSDSEAELYSQWIQDWIDAFNHLRNYPDAWSRAAGAFDKPTEVWFDDYLMRKYTVAGLLKFLGSPGKRSNQLLDDMTVDLKRRKAAAEGFRKSASADKALKAAQAAQARAEAGRDEALKDKDWMAKERDKALGWKNWKKEGHGSGYRGFMGGDPNGNGDRIEKLDSQQLRHCIECFEYLRQTLSNDWDPNEAMLRKPFEDWLIQSVERDSTIHGLIDFLKRSGDESNQLLDEMIADLKRRSAVKRTLSLVRQRLKDTQIELNDTKEYLETTETNFTNTREEFAQYKKQAAKDLKDAQDKAKMELTAANKATAWENKKWKLIRDEDLLALLPLDEDPQVEGLDYSGNDKHFTLSQDGRTLDSPSLALKDDMKRGLTVETLINCSAEIGKLDLLILNIAGVELRLGTIQKGQMFLKSPGMQLDCTSEPEFVPSGELVPWIFRLEFSGLTGSGANQQSLWHPRFNGVDGSPVSHLTGNRPLPISIKDLSIRIARPDSSKGEFQIKNLRVYQRVLSDSALVSEQVPRAGQP